MYNYYYYDYYYDYYYAENTHIPQIDKEEYRLSKGRSEIMR